MKIKIINPLSFQSYPITEDMVEYPDEELKLIGISKKFNENGEIVDYFNVKNRIAELKQLLASTDYQAIKFAEGQLTKEEYEPIKLQRQEWRNEINSLEEKEN